MYVPAHFAEQRLDELHDLIRQYPLGILVTHGAAGLDANHLPFELLVEAGRPDRLLAHVRAQSHLAGGCRCAEVLVIFRAEDAYISPNWYPSKQETHRLVPTWNYRVVHAHGRLRIRDDARFVRGVVARLTRTHEARLEQEKPWKMTDSSPAYIDQMLAAIVGLEIEIVRLEGKAKLSQNRESRDLKGAAEQLRQHGQEALATRMLNTLGE